MFLELSLSTVAYGLLGVTTEMFFRTLCYDRCTLHIERCVEKLKKNFTTFVCWVLRPLDKILSADSYIEKQNYTTCVCWVLRPLDKILFADSFVEKLKKTLRPVFAGFYDRYLNCFCRQKETDTPNIAYAQLRAF